MSTVLEDYFDFSDPAEIRIQGHRVWLHHVLLNYRDRKASFESLCEDYDTLGPEKIAACIVYYHRNQNEMDVYLDRLKEQFAQRRVVIIEQHRDQIADFKARAKEFLEQPDRVNP